MQKCHKSCFTVSFVHFSSRIFLLLSQPQLACEGALQACDRFFTRILALPLIQMCYDDFQTSMYHFFLMPNFSLSACGCVDVRDQQQPRFLFSSLLLNLPFVSEISPK